MLKKCPTIQDEYSRAFLCLYDMDSQGQGFINKTVMNYAKKTFY
jgi:hypothetical protein